MLLRRCTAYYPEPDPPKAGVGELHLKGWIAGQRCGGSSIVSSSVTCTRCTASGSNPASDGRKSVGIYGSEGRGDRQCDTSADIDDAAASNEKIGMAQVTNAWWSLATQEGGLDCLHVSAHHLPKCSNSSRTALHSTRLLRSQPPKCSERMKSHLCRGASSNPTSGSATRLTICVSLRYPPLDTTARGAGLSRPARASLVAMFDGGLLGGAG